MWGHDGRSADLLFFFFNDTATTEIYTLSLHDALPILAGCSAATQIGGCGFWYGLGRTSRGGTVQNWPSHENRPSSQIRGIIRSDSSHIARVFRGSMPIPICS